MLLNVIIAVCLASTTLAHKRNARQGKNECTSGTCISISECPPFLDLLEKTKENKTLLTHLRGFMCGFIKDQPKVCCPEEAKEPIQEPIQKPIQLPSEPGCGVSGDINFKKIQGGSPSKLGQWPWMAALGYQMRKDTSTIKWLCGGSLITQLHVLTAAHCLTANGFNLYKVRLGDLDLNDDVKDNATPIERFVTKKIAHSGYNKYTNDIAIVKLDKPVIFTRLIQPICLPKTPQLIENTFVRTTPFTAGWGSIHFQGPSSSHLMDIQFPVVNNTECKAIFESKGATIVKSHICAGVKTGGKDACLGDSGGPLMLPIGFSFYQIGVVSFGFRCGQIGYPGVYTRTTEFIKWISAGIQI